MNPTAFAFWAFCAGIGYLANDVRGAIWGLVIGLGISVLADALPNKGRR